MGRKAELYEVYQIIVNSPIERTLLKRGPWADINKYIKSLTKSSDIYIAVVKVD